MVAFTHPQIRVSHTQCRYWMRTLLPSVSIVETLRKQSSSLNDAKDLMAPLTKDDLLRLERLTSSKSLKILKEPTGLRSSKTRASGQSWSTATAEKTLSTTAPGFEKRLRQNGVLHPNDSRLIPPSNLVQIIRRCSRKRAGPTEEEYQHFMDLSSDASNERDMGATVEKYLFVDRMEPGCLPTGYRAHLDKQWLDYPRSQGFNNGLSNPRPDYTEGYKRSDFPPAIGNLGGVIALDNKAPEFIALPHFAAEYKRRDSSTDSAEVQAGYVGAASKQARGFLRTYILSMAI